MSTFRQPFATPLLRTSGAPSLRVHQGAKGERLLTVAEVADRLAVAPFTVYALCERGELAHARIGNNTIRIAAVDLAAFVKGRRRA